MSVCVSFWGQPPWKTTTSPPAHDHSPLLPLWPNNIKDLRRCHKIPPKILNRVTNPPPPPLANLIPPHIGTPVILPYHEPHAQRTSTVRPAYLLPLTCDFLYRYQSYPSLFSCRCPSLLTPTPAAAPTNQQKRKTEKIKCNLQASAPPPLPPRTPAFIPPPPPALSYRLHERRRGQKKIPWSTAPLFVHARRVKAPPVSKPPRWRLSITPPYTPTVLIIQRPAPCPPPPQLLARCK